MSWLDIVYLVIAGAVWYLLITRVFPKFGVGI